MGPRKKKEEQKSGDNLVNNDEQESSDDDPDKGAIENEIPKDGAENPTLPILKEKEGKRLYWRRMCVFAGYVM